MSLCIFVCLGLALPALGLHLQSDARRLLPAEAAPVKAFTTLLEVFGASEQTVIVARAQTRQAEALLGPALDRIAEALETGRTEDGGPLTISIAGRFDAAQSQAAEAWLPWTWLACDDARLDTLIRALDPRRVEKRLAMGGRPDLAPHLLDRDPLGLWGDVFIPFWRGVLPQDLPIRRHQGRLLSRDGHCAVLIVRPARPAQDETFSPLFAEAVATACAAVHANPDFAGLDVEAIGGHLVAAADYATARSAAYSTLIQGSLGVLLLFALIFRNLRLVLFLGLTLVPASLAALGCARLMLGGELSLLITAFAVILIGLGVDFTIHLDAACARRLAAGEDRRTAARGAVSDLGTSILAGASTSIAAFVLLTLSSFSGLRELGLVAALGLTLMLVQVLVATPAYLAVYGRAGRWGPRLGAAMGSYLGVSRRPAALVIGLAVTLIVAACIYAGQPLRFDGRASNLRPSDDPLLARQTRIARELGLGVDQIHVLIHDPDPVAVLDRATQITTTLTELAGKGQVLPGEWALLRHAAPEAQRQACARLADEVDWQALEALRTQRNDQRFARFWTDLAAWREHARGGRVLTGDDLLQTPLASAVQTSWVRHAGESWLDLRVTLAPGVPASAWSDQVAAADDPQVLVTGIPLLSAFLSRALAEDFIHLGIWSLVCVALLLALQLRSWRNALVALATLGFGIALAQVILHLIGVPWNLINVAALPLLFGLGVDAAIYSVAALQRQNDNAAGRALAMAEIGPPLLMTTLTTVVGFASLLLNPYRGLHSLGLVAIVGMLCCLLAALTLPVVLRPRMATTKGAGVH